MARHVEKNFLFRFHKSLEYMSERWGGAIPNDWSIVDSICRVSHYDKKSVLLRQGDQSKRCYFVDKGILRFYYATPAGKEVNKSFYAEGNFAADFAAHYLNESSRFSIETIEPSTIVHFEIDEFLKISNTIPGLQSLAEQAMNTLMIRNERREEELLTLSAKERFFNFLTSHSKYFGRIPQHHIASYLGITPEFFSTHKSTWLDQYSNARQ